MAAGRLIRTLIAAALAVVLGPAAFAQDAGEFYRSKTVLLYIGFSPGGGYDVYGRLVARHLGRFIPGNPTIVPINMDGAGSLKLANWLYNAAPRDGTVIGSISRGVPFEPLVGFAEVAQFDPTEFTWIGSANDEVAVCVAWNRRGISNFDQLFERELIVAGTGPAADDVVHARLVSGLLGANLRLVAGYAGGNEMNFAMERGEVDGRCGWSWSSVTSTAQDWIDEGTIVVLLQVALRKHPELPQVPLIMDFAQTEEERQILRLVLLRGVLGRPYLAPPGIPPELAAALRHAFDTMVQDIAFLTEASRLRLEITPISGEELQRLIAEVYASPANIVERARGILR